MLKNKNNVLIISWIFIFFVSFTTYLNYIYFDSFRTDVRIYQYIVTEYPFITGIVIFLLLIILFIQYKVYKRKLSLRTNCQIQYIELEQIASSWLDDEDISKNYEIKYNNIIETNENDNKINSVDMLQLFLSRNIKNTKFYDNYIFPYIQFYSNNEITIILDLLKLLEEEASKIPSVATIYTNDFDKKNYNKSITTGGLSSYDILYKVNLYAHTLNVVKFIFEAIKKEHKDNYMFFISKVIIMALAHDIGKIRNIKNVTDSESFEDVLYTQISHEKMSKLLLINMFPEYEYLDEITNAIEEHHLPIKDEDKNKEENLLRVLLVNADHEARAYEIKEFHNTNKKEKSLDQEETINHIEINTTVPSNTEQDNKDVHSTLQILLEKVTKMENNNKDGKNTKELENLKHQIEKLENDKRTLKEANIKDPMTRAYNRGYFDNRLIEIFDVKKNIVVAYMDGDSFKTVNDNYGHEGGDKTIIAIADNMFTVTRGHNAKVIRYGGDEFVIIFEDMQRNVILEILENLRSLMEKTIVESGDDKFSITISIGVAFINKNDTIQTICRRADEALYTAKEQGRNKVIIAKDTLLEQKPVIEPRKKVQQTIKQEKDKTSQTKKILEDDNIDKTHTTTLSDERLGDLIEKILENINYVKTFNASGKQKIISISKGSILYFERQEFIKLLKKVGLDTYLKTDLEIIYKKLVTDGLVLGKSVSLKFAGINSNMPRTTTALYVPINGSLMGLSADELELSKRNEPLLRNVTFSF